MERVRWREAAAFCNQRSEAEGLRPCYDPKTWACDFTANGYRLPTEAEWEYACRGGSTGDYYFGDDAADLKSYAWFKATADRTTHLVGQLRPNPLGLFDMAGNVAEWCNDWYQPDYYAQSPAADPTGPRGREESRPRRRLQEHGRRLHQRRPQQRRAGLQRRLRGLGRLRLPLRPAGGEQ